MATRSTRPVRPTALRRPVRSTEPTISTARTRARIRISTCTARVAHRVHLQRRRRVILVAVASSVAAVLASALLVYALTSGEGIGTKPGGRLVCVRNAARSFAKRRRRWACRGSLAFNRGFGLRRAARIRSVPIRARPVPMRMARTPPRPLRRPRPHPRRLRPLRRLQAPRPRPHPRARRRMTSRARCRARLAGFALSALSVRWRRGLFFRRVAFRRARYRVVVSSIFCLSSPSMRRISASASARLRRPSSWICMTSSKVLMRIRSCA